jgi:hypothetical protein
MKSLDSDASNRVGFQWPCRLFKQLAGLFNADILLLVTYLVKLNILLAVTYFVR